MNQRASFQTVRASWLAQRGFKQRLAQASLVSDGLVLRDGACVFSAPFARISRIRVGYEDREIHRREYCTHVWIDGEAKPIVLWPASGAENAGYAAVVRALATTLEREGHLARLETGVSKTTALVGPIGMAVLILAGIAAAAFGTDEPEWWHFVIIPAFPAAVFAYLMWHVIYRQWPRPLRAHADLDVQLPR